MTDIDAILEERGKTHGEFKNHARCTQSLKQVIESNRRDTGLREFTDVEQEALDMIAHKIGRIVAGDPTHWDHWDDIAGYAKLPQRHARPVNRA